MIKAALQHGLLDWFWYEPGQLKNMRSIENRCVNSYQQYYPDGDMYAAREELFLPLLRFGVIEFYSQDRFGLSPSCVLASAQAVMFVNMPTAVTKLLEGHIPLKTFPGIAVYYRADLSTVFLKATGLPVCEFNFAKSCALIPSFGAVIASWEKNNVVDTANFMFFDGQWKRGFEANKPGLYKKSEAVYAEKVCRLKNDQWKTVPQREMHVDAFPLAVGWAKKTAGTGLFVKYEKEKAQLSIRDIFFPVLLERLLVINSLLHPQFDWDLNNRTYFSNEHDFKILQKLII